MPFNICEYVKPNLELCAKYVDDEDGSIYCKEHSWLNNYNKDNIQPQQNTNKPFNIFCMPLYIILCNFLQRIKHYYA